ncbi:tRNA (adenosine(37)-N6)-threonylcarbamoyltransferase complex ATPase subunit type 1 TsaE [Trichlorobacter ammonificans]|uniref:tRNA threonylcarbamoyladenosine biosynthesis protein TsaE n=1 Tax=Trichlorobacter ammonificans TaxID=2916410 RepID=A0ABN8HIN7_9BACT|nr:tRNA (adenosine(37)-N6)-threonylcarbamoyltransferase complex ATPase subunit type 1 TsaE [Trichlorobacter ammonificans]CAH2031442.1 ATPase YjeE, predicted to have essential role in cell wall biosynthesis [Trichlorobacter ammonificans]
MTAREPLHTDRGEEIEFETVSPAETEALGASLGRLLLAGDIVTLSGELGGGKTCFVRGVVAGASPEAANLVASPTFAILNEYPGTVPILHYDCYRLRGADDALELGLLDRLGGDAICLLEWPERIPGVIAGEYLAASFQWLGEEYRRITLSAHGERSRKLLALLRDERKKKLVS